jgi:adenylylsulfate kinase-like enzyme
MMREKVRVIVNGVSFYTTKSQIVRGVGDVSIINTFVELALKECIRDGIKGLGRTFTAYDSKMKPTAYQIQINL